jgi:hypothetical protein
MTSLTLHQAEKLPPIIWEKLPSDFPLPDEPVESNLQPLLAAALRESLELAGLILESVLIASNFGICATVGDKTVVKAPDWVYIASVQPIPEGEIRRSYTPHAEGDVPILVMEFISETEGGEYSINPYYPYGKWYFYEQILQIPIYVIFHPKTAELDVYRLVSEKYERQESDENNRYWLEELKLYLGLWRGKRVEFTGYWLRWWDESGNLLGWGSEIIEQERLRTEQERLRAEEAQQQAQQERLRAEEAEKRAEELSARLREMGNL